MIKKHFLIYIFIRFHHHICICYMLACIQQICLSLTSTSLSNYPFSFVCALLLCFEQKKPSQVAHFSYTDNSFKLIKRDMRRKLISLKDIYCLCLFFFFRFSLFVCAFFFFIFSLIEYRKTH